MSRTHDREKWSLYPQTVLEFSGRGGAPSSSIDLRHPFTSADRTTLARLGLDRPFAVITAENPCGLNGEDAESEKQAEIRDERNRKRMSDFVSLVEGQGLEYRFVDGVSPDGDYREHSLAVVTDRDDAVAIACALDQLAIFWFDSQTFWLLPAMADEEPQKLPMD